MKTRILISLLATAVLVVPLAATSTALAAPDTPDDPVEWCRACMDLECGVYLDYPCDVDTSDLRPSWCRACMDLECAVYLDYPCWDRRSGAGGLGLPIG